jgi:hypothetical protein
VTPSSRRRAQAVLLVSALASWSLSGLAQAPERLSDKDLKALVDQVDEGRDKFEGNLDGRFKASTVTGPNGEVKVAAALQDYQDNTQKLKDRFTPEYSAGAEAITVLRQSMAINTFMEGSASLMKGRGEWDRQVGNLKRLAKAYGTTFPLPDGATARRTNDKDTADAAEAVAAAAGRFKNDLGKASTLPKPDREVARRDVDALIKLANAVRSRVSDGKPATGELRQLVEQTARVQTFVDAHPIPEAAANWHAVQASLGTVQQAFGLK